MVDTLAEMFAYELEKLYYIERRLVEELDEMAAEADNDELSRGFANHQQETLAHVDRLEEVFLVEGIEPAERESRVLQALIEEREQFADETTEGTLRDLYELQTAMKAERLEITGYQGLLTIADRLDCSEEVTDPLADTLASERSTLRDLEGLSTGSKMKALVEELLS